MAENGYLKTGPAVEKNGLLTERSAAATPQNRSIEGRGVLCGASSIPVCEGKSDFWEKTRIF
jgi:hypothetical protein